MPCICMIQAIAGSNGALHDTESGLLKQGQYLANRGLLRATAVIEPQVGAPGLSLPIGLTTTNLPMGLQITARPGDDFEPFAVGRVALRLLCCVRYWRSGHTCMPC